VPLPEIAGHVGTAPFNLIGQFYSVIAEQF
jgi:hypothetical protein